MLKSIGGCLIRSSLPHYLGDEHLLLCLAVDTDSPPLHPKVHAKETGLL